MTARGAEGGPRVAVIGAGGYVGGRLVPVLRAAGLEAVAMPRRVRPWLGDGQVPVDLLADPARELDRALADCHVVVHVAGHDEVVAAREPERALLETLAMTERVAGAATRAGVGRVVYLSTVHVYGAAMEPGVRITEDVTPAPRAHYAIARLASEHVLAGSLPASTELVTLRLTNSVGAPAAADVDRWSLLVNDLGRQAATTGRLVLQTPGLQARDWIHLADVCDAVAAACDSERVPPGTYNLGSGVSRSVREVAELVASAWGDQTGTVPPIEAPPATDAGPVPYEVAVDRLGALGVVAGRPLEAAVGEVTAFCAEHRAELA